MSSDDGDVVTLRLVGKEPPMGQVEVPASGGRNARLDERVDAAITRWCDYNDWEHPSKIERFTEVNEDGVRCRIGRFVILDPYS